MFETNSLKAVRRGVSWREEMTGAVYVLSNMLGKRTLSQRPGQDAQSFAIISLNHRPDYYTAAS